jgi:hypothetical protein
MSALKNIDEIEIERPKGAFKLAYLHARNIKIVNAILSS